MNEDLLEKIEKNTRRTAENLAFMTGLIIISLAAGVIWLMYLS